MPPENGDGNTLAAENENKQAGTRADGDGNNRDCMYTGCDELWFTTIS